MSAKVKPGRDLKMVMGPAGLLVPDHVATKIGLGCPLCDDHELVPLSSPQWDLTRIMVDFRNKHRGHGELETLEYREGRLYVTSKVPGLA
jgi:hypothetical protein